ncbi:hypothetical protein [Streptomyces nigra]|uniref:hypothetical protein n=1 Tax=Streptomyces nigra TaxID=1827580 RepID=UPI00381F362F
MSYNQPGPYGGQPQQPGPYGQQPQAPQPGYGYPQQAPPAQPGYGYPQAPQGVPPQQPPYGQQPYGMPQPPQPSGGGKKTGLILGAVAVVAAIGVGAYFLLGSGGGGSGSVADDGAHKLVTPATVLNGEYKKSESGGAGDSMTDSDKSEFEEWGVQNPTDVGAAYQKGTGLSAKTLSFHGVYGTIDDPGAVVDEMFAKMKTESEKDQSGDTTSGKLLGSPEEVSPAGFENGVMKCQVAEVSSNESSASAKAIKMPMCVWGDHSTVAIVTVFDLASFATGDGGSVADTADLAAKLRKDVRVKA